MLSSAVPKFNSGKEDHTLYVVFADFLAEPYVGNRQKEQELSQIIAGRTGKQVEVRMVLQADEHLEGAALSRIRVEQALDSLVHAEIEIED